jgi:hypothetical protein
MATVEANDVDVEEDEQPLLRPVRLDLLRLDGGTQHRVATRPETVDEYAEAMAEGVAFPPPTVYFDGADFWPADGHQRIAAAVKAGKESILCTIHEGTVRDAILHAVGANVSHGDRRTQADARNAVETMLRDEEWGEWSDRKIGEKCGVDHKTVAKYRRELTGEFPSQPIRKGADGRTINTAKIGAKPPAESKSDDSPAPKPSTSEEKPEEKPVEPADIIAGRLNGTIPADVEVEVTEVGGVVDAPAEPPAEMTDAEYLDSLPARPHLSELVRKRFDIEALLFRQITPIRLKYASACKPLTNQAKRDAKGHIGPWMGRHFWYLRTNGPGQWQACKNCGGTGRVELIGPCPACHEAGYHL